MSSIASLLPLIEHELDSLPGQVAVAQIDHQVEEAKALIRRLLYVRNEKHGIARFPAEILQIVLIEAVRPPTDNRQRDYDPVRWIQHVNFTLVCRFWRNVALGCAQYWSCVPFRPGKALPQILARSRNQRLSFRWNCSGGESINGKAYIPLYYLSTLLDPNRMEEMHVKANKDLLPTILKHFPASAPVLRSLCFRDSRRRLAEEHEMLPLQVFQVPKPCLQILKLERVKVPWDTMQENVCLPTKLIQLVIFKCNPPTEQQLHHILSNSPDLEALTLTRSLPLEIDVVNRPARAKLLKLKTLLVMSHLHQFSYFYSTLHHAIETRIEFSIIVNNPNVTVEQYKNYVIFILGLCGVSVAKPLRVHKRMCLLSDGRVSILRLDDEETDIIPAPLHAFDQLKPGEKAPRVNIAFHWPADPVMLEHVQVEGVERLVLNCNRVLSRRSRTEWKGFLQRHPNVEDIHLVGSAIQNVVQALGDTSMNAKAIARKVERHKAVQKAVEEARERDAEYIARHGRIGKVPYSGQVDWVQDGREPAPPGPRTIQLCGGQVHTIAEPEDTVDVDSADIPEHEFLLPLLRTITLSKTRFDPTLMTQCVKFRSVLEFLMDRINYDKPLELLEIRGCSQIPQELFTLLEEVMAPGDLIGFPEAGTDYGWKKGANKRRKAEAKRLKKLAVAEEAAAQMDVDTDGATGGATTS